LHEAGSGLHSAVIVRTVWGGRSNAGMRYSDSEEKNSSKNGDSNVKTGFFHLLPPNI